MRSGSVIIMALALTGCGSIGGAGLVRPALPVMPADIAAPCRDPGVRSGQPVISEFARTRQAFAECKRRHTGAVSFYERTRAALSGK